MCAAKVPLAYVWRGSHPVRLRSSICFPVYPRSRPTRGHPGSAALAACSPPARSPSSAEATNAVARAGPTPGIASSRLLAEVAAIALANKIARMAWAMMPNRCDDAKFGKMRADRIDYGGLLADKKMARAMEHRQLCCSGVLVATNRMFGRVTASQMASASVASFFCRLT